MSVLTINDLPNDVLIYLLGKDVYLALLANAVCNNYYRLTNPLLLQIARYHRDYLADHPTTHRIIQSETWRRAVIIYDSYTWAKSVLSVAVVDLYLNIRYVKKTNESRKILEYT